MKLENSMSLQVFSRADREDAVSCPPGEGCTLFGRFRLLFGAVGPPSRFSRVCWYACVGGGGCVGDYLCLEFGCVCIGILCYCCRAGYVAAIACGVIIVAACIGVCGVFIGALGFGVSTGPWLGEMM